MDVLPKMFLPLNVRPPNSSDNLCISFCLILFQCFRPSVICPLSAFTEISKSVPLTFRLKEHILPGGSLLSDLLHAADVLCPGSAHLQAGRGLQRRGGPHQAGAFPARDISR